MTQTTQEAEYYITNYNIDINNDGIYGNDWKMFIDGSDSNIDSDRIFIIASKHINSSFLPPFETAYITQSSDGFYYFSGYPWVTTKSYTMWDISGSEIFLDHDIGTLAGTKQYVNMWFCFVLLNPTNWTQCIDENFGDLAIGSPTLGLISKRLKSKCDVNLEFNWSNNGLYVSSYSVGEIYSTSYRWMTSDASITEDFDNLFRKL